MDKTETKNDKAAVKEGVKSDLAFCQELKMKLVSIAREFKPKKDSCFDKDMIKSVAIDPWRKLDLENETYFSL